MVESKVTFDGGGAFWNELKAKVNSYLAQPGVEKSGLRRLHRKAAIIVVWAVGSYLALLLFAHNWWQVVVFGASLVLALNAAAFSIMHDGNHGAFSKSKRINRMAGFVLEILGGSSFTWKVKHNLAHHTYPNVDGLDEDIDLPPLARVASTQKWQRWHTAQHIYLWFLYGLVTLRWQLSGDLGHLFRGRISHYELKGFNASEIAAFAGGKMLFFGWAVALPLALHWSWHGALMVLIVYLGLSWVFSFVMTSTFQLAHCVDEAMFTSPEDADGRGKLPNTWAVHQVLTTSDFCPENRPITWFLGGLNYQVEHHLFPRVTHVHYPVVARMVREACQRHNVMYLCQPTLRTALKSHYRHLKDMGRRPSAVAQSV